MPSKTQTKASDREVWNFETSDKYLELADEDEVELALVPKSVLGLLPRWASARPTEKSIMSAQWLGAIGAAFTITSWHWVPRFYWYNWDYNPIFSLHMTEEDSTTLKPAAIAYEQVQKWLIGLGSRVWGLGKFHATERATYGEHKSPSVGEFQFPVSRPQGAVASILCTTKKYKTKEP